MSRVLGKQQFHSPAEESLHRLLISAAADYAIIALTHKGDVFSWSKGAQNIFLAPQEKALGRNYEFLWTEEDRIQGKPQAALQQARTQGRAEDSCWCVRSDGSTFWAQVTITKLIDDQSKFQGFALVAKDQTSEKIALEKVAIYKRMVSSVRDAALFLMDPNGNIVTWNQGAQKIKGYTPDDIIGKNFATFYEEADRAARKPQEELKVAAKEGRFEEEGWRLRKDGSRFWANVLITALYDDDDVLLGFVKLTRDLSERKATEERLNQYSHELERTRDQALESSTLKSQFVANVSHEIRTPMSGLLGMAELLQYEDLNEQARDIAEHIHSSAESLLEILNDLLDFSKIEAGKLSIDLRTVEISRITENVIKSNRFAAEQKDLRLTAQIGASVPPMVIGDPLRVQQILLNFLSNAIKFSSEGQIDLRVDCIGKDNMGRSLVQFSVEDTGIGIPRDKQSMLFEPFVQADGSTTRRFGGTGLGLSISKKLVDLMGGQVGLTSNEGRGSTFWFVLPMAVPEESSQAAEAAA